MDDTQAALPELPELPKPTLLHTQMPDHYWYGHVHGYTADQMRDYARAALAAAAPAPAGEPVAWIVYTRDRKFIRACWTVPPTLDQIQAAEFDGDAIVPLYATPPAPAGTPSEDARDAARYRWLRSAKTGKPVICTTTGGPWNAWINTVELDAAIDDAIAEEQKK